MSCQTPCHPDRAGYARNRHRVEPDGPLPLHFRSLAWPRITLESRLSFGGDGGDNQLPLTIAGRACVIRGAPTEYPVRVSALLANKINPS